MDIHIPKSYNNIENILTELLIPPFLFPQS